MNENESLLELIASHKMQVSLPEKFSPSEVANMCSEQLARRAQATSVKRKAASLTKKAAKARENASSGSSVGIEAGNEAGIEAGIEAGNASDS